jgi:hypothetical protein
MLLLIIVTGQLKRIFYGNKFISFYASAGSQERVTNVLEDVESLVAMP